MAGNNALNANPPTSAIDITTRASDWLWAVFAIMLFADLIFIFWSTFAVPRGQRVFHQIPVVILTVASIAYFSMASDLGSTPVLVEFTRFTPNLAGPTRAIWFVRYIMWFFTFPLLLLELTLASGLPLSDILSLLFFSVVAVIMGLVGALVPSTYKWGFYVFGLFAYFYIAFHLLGPARTSTSIFGNAVGAPFLRGSGYLVFLWLLYPICWGLSEGGNRITSSGEMVFYGILDLLTMPVFLFMHTLQLRAFDYNSLGLYGGKHTMTGYTPWGVGAPGAGVGTGAAYAPGGGVGGAAPANAARGEKAMYQGNAPGGVPAGAANQSV